MKTLSDIFDALPTSEEVARFISAEDPARPITDRAVRAWRLEGRGIPAKHWPSLIRLARSIGVKWITWETLEGAHKSSEAA